MDEYADNDSEYEERLVHASVGGDGGLTDSVNKLLADGWHVRDLKAMDQRSILYWLIRDIPTPKVNKRKGSK